MHRHANAQPLDALPKQFVVSMKKLFDILDDQRTGFVKFTDIQKGWSDDGCKGLPRGVIDSLRKVTPANGLLSFERFCAGLKFCLLRNHNETNGKSMVMDARKSSRSSSAPLLDIENPIPNAQWSGGTTNNMATVRPNNNMPTQQHSPPPPPKPPRSAAAVAAVGVSSSGGILTTAPVLIEPKNSCVTNASPATMAALDKAEIRYALQNWQMGVLMNEMESKSKCNAVARGTADGGSSSTMDNFLHQAAPIIGYQKKSNAKRREPRRHTLQNVIDYNMLKRLKQFEEERDILLQGMSAVEKAREWYLQQIANVQDKIKYLGRTGSHVEQWSEVQQEKLDFQRARVLEVNRHLSGLADTWERGGFTMHFNLAIRPHQLSSIHNAGSSVLPPADRLKQQNRHLTNEVNIKSDRITLLEREKQTLIREIFDLQQRCAAASNNRSGLISISQSSPVCSSSSVGLGDADVVY